MKVTIEFSKAESRTYDVIEERGDHVYFKGYYEMRFNKKTKQVQALVDGDWRDVMRRRAYLGAWKG